MQIMAGIILPWINDLGKAGDELFHDHGPTLNPTLGIQPAAAPQAPTSPHKSHMRFPWDRLAFIRHARELGFSLEDVRALLRLSDQPERSCAEADRIAREHLVLVRSRLAR